MVHPGFAAQRVVHRILNALHFFVVNCYPFRADDIAVRFFSLNEVTDGSSHYFVRFRTATFGKDSSEGVFRGRVASHSLRLYSETLFVAQSDRELV